MVLARQIEVERCLETNRNRATILGALKRRQICKARFCTLWGERKEGAFYYNKSILLLYYHTDRKQKEYIYVLEIRAPFDPQGSF